MKRLDVLLGTVASLILIGGSWLGLLPLDLSETLGFVTGGACVWLTVKQNIWNWPIGIASSVFYIVLFFNAQLYADMSLQVVYVVLGVLGWYWWLHGGENKTTLPITRTSLLHWFIIGTLVVASTVGLTIFLQSVNDAAPFFDALTTVLSLAAQYMLTRKMIENWLVWMTADVIYVGLYIYKGLYLTSALYVIFFCMCVAGWLSWQKIVAQRTAQQNETGVTPKLKESKDETRTGDRQVLPTASRS